MDNKSQTLGYLVGKQIAGMRRVTTEPVAYLYNGVRLPKLPEFGAEYPNKVVSVHTADDGNTYYRCVGLPMKKQVIVNSDGEPMFNGLSGSTVFPGYKFDGTEWVDNKILFVYPIWADYDIYYASNAGDLAGTLYLAASEPIPVYE